MEILLIITGTLILLVVAALVPTVAREKEDKKK